MKQDFTYNEPPRAVSGGTVLLFALLAIIAASVLYVIINMVLVQSGMPENSPDTFEMLDFCLSAGLPQLGLLTVAIIFSRRIGLKNAAGIRKTGVLPGLAMPVVALLTLAAFAPLALAFSALMAETGYEGTLIELPDGSVLQKILSAAIISILPAICEELIFRGLVLRSLLVKGEMFAVLVSSAAFSLFHGNPDQTLYQFALGFVMAYAVIRSGSIISAMIIHFASNLAVVLLELFGIGMFMPSQTAFMLLYAVGLMCLGMLIITLIIDLSVRKPSSNIFLGRLFSRKSTGEPPVPAAGTKTVLGPAKVQYIIAFICMAVLWTITLVAGYMPAVA